MGSTELRVGAAGHGAALADLGLRLAVEDGDAWAVLRHLDRWRGASLEMGRGGRRARRARPGTWPRCGRRTARLQQATVGRRRPERAPTRT